MVHQVIGKYNLVLGFSLNSTTVTTADIRSPRSTPWSCPVVFEFIGLQRFTQRNGFEIQEMISGVTMLFWDAGTTPVIADLSVLDFMRL